MQPAITIILPEPVESIINSLSSRGYEAFAVGGCVRDTLLGRSPGDWDITTNATPSQVKEMFKRTIDTGIRHGTVTVMMDKEGFEVTTYRIDGEYEDGRHPREVMFTGNLLEDLKRRDFTINAMAYNHQTGLVDAFGGEEDLKKGLIRCVGKAEERFQEDALRMLRAVRFSAQLGFQIEAGTSQAVKKLSRNISCVSRERIQAELTKLLMSDYPERADEIFTLGLSRFLFPELDSLWKGEKKDQVLETVKKTEKNTVLRYTAFFSVFEGAPAARREQAREILKDLKFDNYTIETVSRLSEHLTCRLHGDKPKLRRQIYEIGEDIFPFLLKLVPSDEIEECYREILEHKDCLSIKSLALNGRDLISMGMKPGKEMGYLLEQLLYAVLECPEKNTREELQKLVKDYMKSPSEIQFFS